MLLGALAAVPVLELVAALTWLVAAQQLFSYERFSVERARLSRVTARSEAPSPAPLVVRGQAIHPYLGFVQDPDQLGRGAMAPLPGAAGLYEPSREGTVRILFVGGAVAGQLAPVVERALVDRGADAERLLVESVFANGFKQPQQLQAVTLLLATGGQPDVVVNVDGYGEAVLPASENRPGGISPAYPRAWTSRFAPTADPERLPHLAAQVAAGERRREAAAWLEGSALRFSVTANVVWGLWDRAEVDALQVHRRALAQSRGRRDYQTHGPRPLDTEAATYRAGAAVWARSSVALHRLTDFNDLGYLHVLQPLPGLPNRKRLSAQERARFEADHAHSRHYAAGYAALLGERGRLAAAGVPLLDLTDAFIEHEETVYTSNAGTVTDDGARILGSLIADELLRSTALSGVSR